MSCWIEGSLCKSSSVDGLDWDYFKVSQLQPLFPSFAASEFKTAKLFARRSYRKVSELNLYKIRRTTKRSTYQFLCWLWQFVLSTINIRSMKKLTLPLDHVFSQRSYDNFCTLHSFKIQFCKTLPKCDQSFVYWFTRPLWGP